LPQRTVLKIRHFGKKVKVFVAPNKSFYMVIIAVFKITGAFT